MNFKIDENITSEAADALRAAGHDAMTVLEQGMTGAVDHDLAAVCVAESRAIITADLDFSDVRVFPSEGSPGFIVLRLPRQSRRAQLAAVARLLPMFGDLPLQGRLWIVDERRVRVRGGA